ncbi:MAG: DNA polymerase III subunit delta [Bacteroidia bacterium]|nr:DNA polymerase III subunit delta [Bacteroidia bacterium]MDW8134353.1 DNA polymerase III subunit delta [Bacteroidia bacterium]
MIWLLYGTDEFRRIERRKALILELIGEANPDLTLTILRGKAFSESRLPELYELPFLATHKVVLLLEAENLGKSELKALLKYLQNPAPHTHLVIDFGQEDPPTFLKVPSIQIEGYHPLKAREVTDWILQRIKTLNISMSDEAIAFLVEIMGSDLRLIDQTLQLLQVYSLSDPQHSIDIEELSEALGLHPQYNIYRLIDVLALKDTKGALRIFSAFAEDSKNFPIAQIIWHLRNFFQNIAILHLTATPRENKAIQHRLRLRFPFQARPYQEGMKNYSLMQCIRALQILRETESQHKGVIPSRQREAQLILGMGLRLVKEDKPQLH